ncbi:hypothetical protein HKBW3S33_00775 [Candidatus Hakubella thermalkaliphila]|uniref:Uncharacterized protein n=1 Tax=Candidatus Hakubella thermalkaliphila TaxID=2754717 RepID=A0A6V8P437_9ACTN|nr:hypothetical protein [Bacillota bacterium]GFP27362.1 hypothetical protein HKBW3S33_00775 [Candidatus Hakubella thermalkaliphila]
MEDLLVPIFALFVLLIGLYLCLRLVFGTRVAKDVLAKFVYDALKAIFTLPFKIIGFIFRKVF